MSFIFLSFVLCYIGLSCIFSQAAIIFVNTNSTTPAGECGPISSPCASIADGLTAASSGDTVQILPGVYTGNGNENLLSNNFLATNLDITGTNGAPSDVVITCSAANRFSFLSTHLFAVVGDVTIQNCSALGAGDDPGYGGAFFLSYTSLLFRNVVFKDNKARRGGAIFVEGGSLTISNCIFEYNEAQYGGGAVSYIDSGITLESTVMLGNSVRGDLFDAMLNVDTDENGKGGAIYGRGGARLSIIGCNFTSNRAQMIAGAVYLILVSGLTVKNSVFEGNQAIAEDVDGMFFDGSGPRRAGAIYVRDVAIEITNSSFLSNMVVTDSISQVAQGGALCIDSDALSNDRISSYVTNCTFTNNSAWGGGESSAGGYGGAIFSQGIPVRIYGCVFHRNSVTSMGLFTSYSSNGGAVYLSSVPTTEIWHSSFTENIASPGSGGAVLGTLGSIVQFRHSTFQRNTAYSSYSLAARGGAVGVWDSSMTDMSSCTFQYNTVQPQTGITPTTFSGQGGAMFLQTSTARIIDSVFTSNAAYSGQFDEGSCGGAVAAESVKDIMLTNCSFHLNSVRGYYKRNSYSVSGTGGALYLFFSASNISESEFVGNWASAGGGEGSAGGAVVVKYEYSVGGIPQGLPNVFANVLFIENFAGGSPCVGFAAGDQTRGDGGAVWITGASLGGVFFTNSSFTRNMAILQSGQATVNSYGGAIFLSQSSVVSCIDCSFNGNYAWNGLAHDVYSSESDSSQTVENTIALERSFFDSATIVEGVKLFDFVEAAIDVFCSLDDFAAFTRRNLRSAGMQVIQTCDTVNCTLLGSLAPPTLDKNGFYAEAMRGRRLDEATNLDINILVSSGSIRLTHATLVNRCSVYIGSLSADSSTLKLPTMVIKGSLTYPPNLLITGLESHIHIQSTDCLQDSTQHLVAMNLFNTTLEFDCSLTVKLSSALVSSSVYGVLGNDSAALSLVFMGDVYTSYASYISDSREGILEILAGRIFGSRNTLSGCALVITGNLYISCHHNSSTASGMCEIFLENNAFVEVAQNGSMFVRSMSTFDTINHSSMVLRNKGIIDIKFSTQLVINGKFEQFVTGQVNVVLSNTEYDKPSLVLLSNETLLGLVNVTDQQGTLYTPESDSDNPTSWAVLSFTETPLARLDGYATHYIFPTGVYFGIQLQEFNTSLPASKRTTAEDGINMIHYIEDFTTTGMSCHARTVKYMGEMISDDDYSCYVCLKNSSCGYCGTSGCTYDGKCADGSFMNKDGICCPEGCNGRGVCVSSNDHTKFTCRCNLFYTGISCSVLSVVTFLLVAAGVLMICLLIVSVGFICRYRGQKTKVLADIKRNIMGGMAGVKNGEADETFLRSLQQDLALRDIFINEKEIALLEKIGEGGFGEVFKATFRSETVAVKRIRQPAFLKLTEKDIDGFRREAYIMSKLRHPNIVIVMGVSFVKYEEPEVCTGLQVDDMYFRSQGPGTSALDNSASTNPFHFPDVPRHTFVANPEVTTAVCIITEYLSRGSLSDILYGSHRVDNDVWTFELLLSCALQAAKGMLYLHSQVPPVCHRDLKSSNLVVDSRWVVKVTDFGMSRVVSPENSDQVPIGEETDNDGTKPDQLDNLMMMTSNLGTPAWCAPELFVATTTRQIGYSVKVDVYSFGVVLWEMWERKHPFAGIFTRRGIIEEVLKGNRPLISESCPTVFRSLIEQCWHGDPSQRPSFLDIVNVLKKEQSSNEKLTKSWTTSSIETSMDSPLHIALSTRENQLARGNTGWDEETGLTKNLKDL